MQKYLHNSLNNYIITQININLNNDLSMLHVSVTETEVQLGILQVNQPRALAYVRNLRGIEDYIEQDKVGKYIDVVSSEESTVVDSQRKERLTVLKHDFIPNKLSDKMLRSYCVNWHNDAFTDDDTETNAYLTNLCNDFTRDVCDLIDEQQKSQSSITEDPLLREAAHHIGFAQKKCTAFCGRKDMMIIIEAYLKDASINMKPLVVHGEGGCGKTSLLAKVSTMVGKWMNTNTVVVTRFIGTSPDSSSIMHLILSLTRQIGDVYGIPTSEASRFENPNETIKYFHELLDNIAKGKASERPLVIILDSLDQLSDSSGIYLPTIFPDICPLNIHFIVSTLPEEKNILGQIQKVVLNVKNFISLRDLSAETGLSVIFETLKYNNKKLTKNQMTKLQSIFKESAHAIHLKMVMDSALKWRSYTDVDASEIPKTANEAIRALFRQLEKRFGEKLISSCLGYITVMTGGITEVELEDLLSCNDDVLNEVFMYHNPPVPGVIRIPSLLWARIRHSLGQYLVERQVDGATVIAWYHRLFHKTATDMYVNDLGISNGKSRQQLYTDLANLYKTTSGIKRSIHLVKRNLTIENADRQVLPQLLNQTNTRKLKYLPMFMYNSNSFDNIKDELLGDMLCNFNWLLTKLKVTSYLDILTDLKLVKQSVLEITIVREILQLASNKLRTNADNLALEITSRLTEDIRVGPHLCQLYKDACEWLSSKGGLSLIPLFPCLPSPNGNLITTLQGATKVLGVTNDGDVILWSPDTGLQVYRTSENGIKYHINDMDNNCPVISDDNHKVFFTNHNYISGLDVESGTVFLNMEVYQVNDLHNSKCSPSLHLIAVSKDAKLLAVRICKEDNYHNNRTVVIIDAANKNIISSCVDAKNSEKIMDCAFLQDGKSLLVTHMVAAASSDYFANIYDIQTGDAGISMHFHDSFTPNSNTLKITPCETRAFMATRPYGIAVINLENHELFPVENDLQSSSRRISHICGISDGALVLAFDIHTKIASLNKLDMEGDLVSHMALAASPPQIMTVTEDEKYAFISYMMVGSVDICDLKRWCVLHVLGAHSTGVTSCVYNAISGVLYTSCSDATVKMWKGRELLLNSPRGRLSLEQGDDVEEGTTKATTPPGSSQLYRQDSTYITSSDPLSHRSSVTHMTTDSDGKYVMTCYERKTPVIIDMKTGEKVQQLESTPNIGR